MPAEGRLLSDPLGAVILAGGAGRRLGGTAKPSLRVGDTSLIDRVLAATGDAGAEEPVVVGPAPAASDRPASFVTEDPPGTGPAAAALAGLALVDAPVVLLLAADLPFLTPAALLELVDAIDPSGTGAVAVDDDRRPQWLLSAWRTDALRASSRRLGDPAGKPIRALLEPLGPAQVVLTGDDHSRLPPWFDCDTPAELEAARANGLR